MDMRVLGATGLHIPPIVLGGNVFGWTADRDTSFAILDACLDAGFNTIDTADAYNKFAPGLRGGESETILGEWMTSRRNRHRVVLISKGGLEMEPGTGGLGRAYLPQACEASLRRLQTDRIDIYMAHLADPLTPVVETLDVFERLIDAGKMGFAGCSNYSPDQLEDAFAKGRGRARFTVFEPHYNVADRAAYEGRVERLCVEAGVGVIAYYALAAGFLTGKYRCAEQIVGTAREKVLARYTNPRGFRILAALDAVAARHDATPTQVSLAWLMSRPTVAAPIASATSVTQLKDILAATYLRLDSEDLATLDDVHTAAV